MSFNVLSLLAFCWLLCFGSVRASASWTVLYVDCQNGTDLSNCGTTSRNACKTLQFATVARSAHVNSSHVTISIASGVCAERSILILDCNRNTIKAWKFVGSNEMPSEATDLQISATITKCHVTFSHLNWKASNGSILFNTFTSNILFQTCLLKHSTIQFAGFNTNLTILDTIVYNCSSGIQAMPIFLVETLYKFKGGMNVSDSTFSSNVSPLFYTRHFHWILVRNTVFIKNGILYGISGEPILNVGALYIILDNVTFSWNLATALEVGTSSNFTGTSLRFLSNSAAGNGSCLLLHRYSNVTLLESSFTSNNNPVIYTGEKENLVIDVKECHFGCSGWTEAFVKAPNGIDITFTNCTKKDSCFVHCQSGEFLKSQLLCQKCQAGSFTSSLNNNITSSSCSKCPAGTYASTVGSAHCTACLEGTFAAKGATSCRKCTNDLFTSHAGSESCSEITLEFILIIVVTAPLIVVPLGILLVQHVKKTSQKKYKSIRADQVQQNLGSIQ